MGDLATELEALEPDMRRRVYARLWFELTIGARGIWSDDRFTEAQKLDGLRQINEIQHRVWHGYMESPGYSPSNLVGRIKAHIQQAEHIRGEVGDCVRRAIARSADT